MPDGGTLPQRCSEIPVPIGHVPFIWHNIEPFVAASLKRDKVGRFWPVDVYALLLRGQAQLWIAYDQERQEFDGFVISEIMVWPRARECRAWLIGGRHLRLWQDEMRHKIEAYSRANGCTHNTGQGRKGWTRMPGYEGNGIEIVKELDGR